jgi:hypothetical protein
VARSRERATAAPVPGKRQPDAEQQHPSRLRAFYGNVLKVAVSCG